MKEARAVYERWVNGNKVETVTNVKSTWQNLTDREIDHIAHMNFTWEFSSTELEQFARAIEKALKEKNNESDA